MFYEIVFVSEGTAAWEKLRPVTVEDLECPLDGKKSSPGHCERIRVTVEVKKNRARSELWKDQGACWSEKKPRPVTVKVQSARWMEKNPPPVTVAGSEYPFE
ncbi:hypothetical protein [Neobacillus drentensis]|uniref:hypothetical protein n=1 Tax=Neobacillus drentensis TaxID=220684 RepID=UPI0030007B1A